MKLGCLFGDHAVLQREASIPVWGWTKAHTEVRITLGEFVVETTSSADGSFCGRLPAMPPGGPYELIVTDVDSGEEVVCRDIWIGEVWLASGQSNMDWSLKDCLPFGEAEAPPDNLRLRMAIMPRLPLSKPPRTLSAVPWHPACIPEIWDFSAVAYHFASDLQKRLGVVVGIIVSSRGGTIAEAWSSPEVLAENAEIQPGGEISPGSAMNGSGGGANEMTADALDQQWASPDFDDGTWPMMRLPGTWNENGHNHCGVFRFRRTVYVPPECAGKDLTVGLGCIDKHDVTFFNGEQIGATGSGFEENYYNVPRVYRVPWRLVRAGQNTIAVRVNSFIFDGGLVGPAEKMSLISDGGGDPVSLAGDWRFQIERNDGACNPNDPGVMHANMLLPLVPYALRGAIWYQGESNEFNPQEYGRLMAHMIRDWRRVWGQGDFPFYFVQLANYRAPAAYDEASVWPVLREAQLRNLSEPNTGMAVAIDVGEADNIHPKNKRDVGRRLARWALSQTYGLPIVCSGPLYAGMTVEGPDVRIRFYHVGGGLVARGASLEGFFIAEADRVFYPARAVIADGKCVLVSHPEMGSPQAVRYAWADNPEGCNLYNAEGLPASPFRTDSWEVVLNLISSRGR